MICKIELDATEQSARKMEGRESCGKFVTSEIQNDSSSRIGIVRVGSDGIRCRIRGRAN
jgi:hypothetical protein